ncbi:ATP-binding protein [Anaerobacillus alkaliphilus]
MLANIYTFIVTQTNDSHSIQEDTIRQQSKLIINELAADLADQVRNPMQTVKGFMQFLLDEPKFHQYKQVILTEFEKMEDSLHSFLLTTKPAYPRKEKLSLANLLVETTTSLKEDADKNKVTISLIIDALPELKADKIQMKRVFSNFIMNGIDASKDVNGQVKVHCYTASVNKICIAISDNGKGIPLNELNKVGKPLYTSKDEGYGLGISIASDMIKAHQGELFIETHSSGTTIFIYLPLEHK